MTLIREHIEEGRRLFEKYYIADMLPMEARQWFYEYGAGMFRLALQALREPPTPPEIAEMIAVFEGEPQTRHVQQLVSLLKRLNAARDAAQMIRALKAAGSGEDPTP